MNVDRVGVLIEQLVAEPDRFSMRHTMSRRYRFGDDMAVVPEGDFLPGLAVGDFLTGRGRVMANLAVTTVALFGDVGDLALPARGRSAIVHRAAKLLEVTQPDGYDPLDVFGVGDYPMSPNSIWRRACPHLFDDRGFPSFRELQASDAVRVLELLQIRERMRLAREFPGAVAEVSSPPSSPNASSPAATGNASSPASSLNASSPAGTGDASSPTRLLQAARDTAAAIVARAEERATEIIEAAEEHARQIRLSALAADPPS